MRLEIIQLGPIKNLGIDIKDFNVIIGEQATGKSTICKAVYFFRKFPERLVEYITKIYTFSDIRWAKNEFTQVVTDDLRQMFGYRSIYMTCEYSKSISVEVSLYEREPVTIKYSDALEGDVGSWETEAQEYLKDLEPYVEKLSDVRESVFREEDSYIERAIYKVFGDSKHTYYIPAGRSTLALLSQQKTKLDYGSIDFINREYMRLIESLQGRYDSGIGMAQYRFNGSRRSDSQAGKLTEGANDIKRMLKGDYLYIQGGQMLVLDDGVTLDIRNISSGQQELLWMLLELYSLMILGEGAFVIIEEPEAHIYPSLQFEVLQFIVRFSNITGSSVLITTHSPYMLTGTNVLQYAGRLYQSDACKMDLMDVISSENTISPKKLYSCKLSIDAESQKTICDNLYDDMDGEMLTEQIDGVSDEISELYYKLYYLEKEHADSE